MYVDTPNNRVVIDSKQLTYFAKPYGSMCVKVRVSKLYILCHWNKSTCVCIYRFILYVNYSPKIYAEHIKFVKKLIIYFIKV